MSDGRQLLRELGLEAHGLTAFVADMAAQWASYRELSVRTSSAEIGAMSRSRGGAWLDRVQGWFSERGLLAPGLADAWHALGQPELLVKLDADADDLREGSWYLHGPFAIERALDVLDWQPREPIHALVRCLGREGIDLIARSQRADHATSRVYINTPAGGDALSRLRLAYRQLGRAAEWPAVQTQLRQLGGRVVMMAIASGERPRLRLYLEHVAAAQLRVAAAARGHDAHRRIEALLACGVSARSLDYVGLGSGDSLTAYCYFNSQADDALR